MGRPASKRTHKCLSCLEIKGLVDFKRDTKNLAHEVYCLECHKEGRVAQSSEPKCITRNSHLKSKYGIDIDTYTDMLKEQRGVCKICSNVDSTKRLAVDHCHETGKVRGLLCGNCNKALGLIKDDKNLLKGMIEYLLLNQ